MCEYPLFYHRKFKRRPKNVFFFYITSEARVAQTKPHAPHYNAQIQSCDVYSRETRPPPVYEVTKSSLDYERFLDKLL